MYLCILDREGNKRLHRNMRAKPDDFLRAIKPFREGLVIGAECMFSWYWLADLCLDESLDFILGHALYMKAIHGGKNKDDRIDSEKIARFGHRPQVGRRRNLPAELRLSARNAGHARSAPTPDVPDAAAQ